MPARTQSQRDIVTIETMIREINKAKFYYILIEAFMKQCFVNTHVKYNTNREISLKNIYSRSISIHKNDGKRKLDTV